MKIKVNVREIEALEGRLLRITPESIGRGALQAVNAVTTEFQESAIRGEIRNINLTDAYVRSKTDLRLGNNVFKPRAEITTRGDLTVLGRFPGTVWYRQPGAPRRAGPVKGRRSAGVYANVTNTDRLDQPQWFLMRLRNQGGLMGAFVRDDTVAPRGTRDGSAGKRHIYGPSPYQLFRKQIDLQGPQLEDDLERTAAATILADIERSVI